MMGLIPIENQSPIFFGVNRTAYFKLLVCIHLLINGTTFGLIVEDIVKVGRILQEEQVDDQQRLSYRVIAWVWVLFHILQGSILDALLLNLKYSSSQRYVRAYWILQISSRSLAAFYYYLILFSLGFSTKILPPFSMVFTFLLFPAVVCTWYTGYKTYLFCCEMQFEKEMKSSYRNLTTAEIIHFEKGNVCHRNPIRNILRSYRGGSFYFEKVISEAYNRNQFEIKLEALDFTEAVTLGCGEFGCVYKAELSDENKEGSRTTVAVKTVDPELADVNKFIALLTEAKVMTCVGQHENVIRLIGLCTRLIEERKLYIVSELCELGNLRGYLRTERHSFVDQLGSSAIAPKSMLDKEVISTSDLIRWAYEICSGMEFLAGKMIIHGDLACRNVLLSMSKTAKITDFGLSLRLYTYNIYQKRTEVPLPWRWLALESLVDLTFSTYSDVWAFGICCWEIFELGTRPWPEFTHFTCDFIEALKEGCVPEMPKNCNDVIYKVMLSCWKPVPEERPNFQTLKRSFQSIREELKLN